MPSFELSKLQGIAGPRALGESDRAQLPARPEITQKPTNASRTNVNGVSVETSINVEAGQPPVDGDRVAEIRKALEDGRYPLVPAEIADAMIAAQLNVGKTQ